MQRRQAFKFKLRPNGAQQRALRRFARCRRDVFNKALALQQARYKERKKHLSCVDLCEELVACKALVQSKWLADIPSHALQQALKELEPAETISQVPCALA